ncbi:MAG: DNA adenine methylase, partial [Caldisericia bacterium]|nr:DNA adenine methylase [Caldisericia bacterium]
IIGGKNQNGVYKIDSRFNKKRLINLITDISSRRNQIHLYGQDAFEFIHEPLISEDKTFIYFDPPYVKKGSQLYKNSLTREDHIKLGQEISSCKARKWIVTYDVDPLVSDIYCQYRHDYVDIRYTIHDSKKAKEYIVFSEELLVN